VPVLFLRLPSNAYHLLAFTALALFTARALSGFVRDELLPAAARLRDRGRRSAPGDGMQDHDARYILVAIFTALVFIQIMMLRTNVQLSDSEIRKRVEQGRAMKAHVDRAIENVLENAGSARQVWVAPEPYAELAGLILKEKYGFKVQRLDQPGMIRGQFSDPLVPIRADASR
jgi:branched-subunit amino acid transport protein